MKYLISFPSAAMVVPDGEWGAVVRDSHAVIEEAKAAGVYVFGGGIDEAIPPVLVSADGAVAEGGYPWAPRLDGGFTVLELPSREEAVAWAAQIAKACCLRSATSSSRRKNLVLGHSADFSVFDSTWCGVCAAKRDHSSSAGLASLLVIGSGWFGSFCCIEDQYDS